MVTSNEPRVSIVIPTLNGSAYLYTLIPLILKKKPSSHIWEILIVDDGCDKKNKLELRKIESRYPEVHTVTLKKNFGQRIATLVGTNSARGEFIITMDDTHHPPEVIREIIHTLQKNPEINLVYAYPNSSKYTRSLSFLRRLGTRLNCWLFTTFLGMPRGVRVGSFRGFTGELKNQALEKPVPFPYLSAMLLSCQPGVRAVNYSQVTNNPEKQRPSNYNLQTLTRLWLTLFYFWGPLSILAGKITKPLQFNPQDYIQIDVDHGTGPRDRG